MKKQPMAACARHRAGGSMTRNQATRLIIAMFLLLSMLPFVASAQEYRAKLQGMVTDSTQAVVAGAKVTLMNVNTGISAVKETGPDGRHVFDLVEPGMYTLSVEMTGFN